MVHRIAVLVMCRDATDDARAKIADLMPLALPRAIAAYRWYLLSTKEGTDAREFSERLRNLRGALTHITMLLKLAEWAGGGNAGEGIREEEVKTLLRQAASEILPHPETEK